MEGKTLSKEEVSAFCKTGSLGFKTTKSLLKNPKFHPATMLEIGKLKFYFSRILKKPEGGRDQVIMYVKNNSKTFPRALYKSQSNGGWRSCPGNDSVILKFKQKPQYHHSKGRGIHYTQETKPALPIVEHLINLEKEKSFIYSGDLNFEYFDLSDNLKHEWYTFEKETKVYDDKKALKEFQKLQPGKYVLKYFPKEKISEVFEKFDFNASKLIGFLPNFKNNPLKTIVFNHTLLGKTTLEIYPAMLNGKSINWMMAHDNDGRTWVEQIYLTKEKVNTYGVYSKFIDSGAITNKPLEYRKQVTSLVKGKDYTDFKHSKIDSYVDITPILSKLKPIREFKSNRKSRAY